MNNDGGVGLGDILAKALERKNMIDVNKVSLFMKAALDTGRTYRDVMELLTEAEMVAVIEHVIKNPRRPATAMISTRFDTNQVYVSRYASKKLDQIKTVRLMTGFGLKEAKDFVEGQEMVIPEHIVTLMRQEFGHEAVIPRF